MTNEEFQKIVLSELKGLKEGQTKLEQEVTDIKVEQREIIRKLDAITEQTAMLSEFRVETNEKLDTIQQENEILKGEYGRHDVDIKRIKDFIL